MSDFPTHIIRDLRHPALKCEERSVLFAMADRLKALDDWVWASIPTIAGDAGVSVKTAQRVISWATDNGILSVLVNGGYRSYQFDFERLKTLPLAVVRERRRLPSQGPRVLDQGPVVPAVTVPPEGPVVPSQGPRVLDQGPVVPAVGSRGPIKASEKDTKKDKRKDSAREATRDASGSPVPKKSSRATQWPDEFALSAEMISYAVNRGMAGPAQVSDEFERFENYHKSKGSKFVDWKLAFYNWVRNWEERKNRSSPVKERPRATGQVFPPADRWGPDLEDLRS